MAVHAGLRARELHCPPGMLSSTTPNLWGHNVAYVLPVYYATWPIAVVALPPPFHSFRSLAIWGTDLAWALLQSSA